jgi:hypothetical protein
MGNARPILSRVRIALDDHIASEPAFRLTLRGCSIWR